MQLLHTLDAMIWVVSSILGYFRNLKTWVVQGVEVMSGSQDPSQANYFSNLAESFDLYASCGSDFHGKGISHRALGNISQLPDNSIPIWTKWENLKKLSH